jgi:hypothetical protein
MSLCQKKKKKKERKNEEKIYSRHGPAWVAFYLFFLIIFIFIFKKIF